ncbi:MAG: magnesium transporter CorA family protein [Ileibacterium sp.]|nr:magnesium transporter CorA family protein [Ileibacterium sp.]
MLSFYKTDENGNLHTVDQVCRGCWVSAVAPDEKEQEFLQREMGIVPEFVKASLDAEETSYVDRNEENDQILVIVDYPEQDSQSNRRMTSYITLPIGVILLEGCIVTIANQPNSTVNALESGRIKDLDTRYKTRFLLQVLLLISQEFLTYLRQIEKLSTQTEQRLYKSMKNRELIHMLELDKSLVYFSTSLKGDELTLNKIMRFKDIPLYEEDEELLEDVMIEIKQAIEMSEIYSNINSRTSEGFSNVINNNMNIIMKRLTVITIVMSIPNMVYGFYGMNVTGLPVPFAWFPMVISVVLSILCWFYFEKNDHYD